MKATVSSRNPLGELLADSRARPRNITQPQWIAPMLATLTEERFSREGWIFEAKLDGVRALVSRNGGSVRIVSRNRKLLNPNYPELVKLQRRMQIQRPSEELLKKIPVWFYAFDLLYFDGYDLRSVPLRNRKRLLKSALTFNDPPRFTVHRETEGEAFYREACARRWEGIIAKNADSKYTSGRSREWLKFKCMHEQEFVIGGYTDPHGQRIGFGALLVRASPFTDGLPVSGVHCVKPELVAQIGFTEWTRDGKLRHPRFLGLRDDKNPKEVSRES